MTEYTIAKKLNGIPPWPVHSHTWLCLHDFQGRVNQASSRSSGNIQIWRFHSADYISRRTPLGAIVVPRPVRKKKLRTWRVIRLPAAFIGLVEAPDEQTALKVAIEQFKISPGDQWRLVVRPC